MIDHVPPSFNTLNLKCIGGWGGTNQTSQFEVGGGTGSDMVGACWNKLNRMLDGCAVRIR